MIFTAIFGNTILTGAILGAIGGLVGVVIVYFRKDQRFNKLLRSVKEPAMQYAAFYHYASFKRFKNSVKFFDSTGILYIVGNTLYYKTGENDTPVVFNLNECSVQLEKDWRMLKWFSITNPAGEKYFFNSHKMGALKNDSSETVRGYEAIKAKTTQMSEAH
jgi:hypothetical protein